MLLLRSLAFNIAFYAVLVVMLVVGLPLVFASAQSVKNWAHLWARLSLWLLRMICRVRVEVRGREHLPEGAFVLASKHQSFLDILVLLPFAPRFVFVLKRELTWIPVFGLYLLRSGMIPIDRSKGRAVLATLTERVRAVLATGHQLIIFPEGTRRPIGAPPAYKSGVSHLYTGAGVSCVPVALNSGLFWPRRRFVRRPGTVVVEILPPIPPGLTRDAFQTQLQERIETATNRLPTILA